MIPPEAIPVSPNRKKAVVPSLKTENTIACAEGLGSRHPTKQPDRKLTIIIRNTDISVFGSEIIYLVASIILSETAIKYLPIIYISIYYMLY